MAVQVPTPEQLREIAESIGLSLTDDDVQSFITLMRPSIDSYNVVDGVQLAAAVETLMNNPG